jgi:hypothetical protein
MLQYLCEWRYFDRSLWLALEMGTVAVTAQDILQGKTAGIYASLCLISRLVLWHRRCFDDLFKKLSQLSILASLLDVWRLFFLCLVVWFWV